MAEDLAEVFRPDLLGPASRAALKAAYEGSAPYAHSVISDLCNPALLRKVRDEIINNVEATYKETDLFKMFQTGDLANLDRLPAEQAAKLPTVRRLRDAIYTPEFRAFISEVTGCGELSDETDCACNVHAAGGHLLCHDDVIGNRRVSYIIYLTDPDQPWSAGDGGALELYPQGEGTPHEPGVIPTATLLPTWNTMAFFRVQPGASFHSIQEVFTSERPRMSIQGWFHSEQAPDGAELATRSQLQLRAGQDTAADFRPFTGGAPSGALGPEDLSQLARFVNPSYLEESNWGRVAARFQDDGSVQLQNFLAPAWAAQLAAAAAAADASDKLGRGQVPAYTAGMRGGWQAVGPTHKQRYLRYAPEAAAAGSGGAAAAADGEDDGTAKAMGALLAKLQEELFSTAAFARLLTELTTIGLEGQRGEVRRFRPGLDYTVAHYGLLTKDPQLDAVLCFVAEEGEGGDKEAWGGGEVGGYEAYLLADDDKEPAEVYKAAQDDESGVLNVSPAANTLSLVLRDEGLMRFVKYLSVAAPSSRFDLAMTYQPEPDSDSEEDGAAADGQQQQEQQQQQ